jgi:hypothetical protein
MHPDIHFSYVGLAVAVVASFLFGWLWYGPIAGKKWASLMKMPMDQPCDSKKMLRMMGMQLFGTVLTAYVLAHSVAVWHPSVWGAGPDAPFYVYGFFAGFFTWLGFYVPEQLGAVCWAGHSWSLFGLNVAHRFLNLQLVAMILAFWR